LSIKQSGCFCIAQEGLKDNYEDTNTPIVKRLDSFVNGNDCSAGVRGAIGLAVSQVPTDHAV